MHPVVALSFPLPLLPAVVLALVALLVLLLGERRGDLRLTGLGKVGGSTLFVYAGLHFGALDGTYGRLVLAGLVLSWVGDLFLVDRADRRMFRVALFAFLAAHVAYVAAFASARPDWRIGAAVGALVLGPVAILVGKWLVDEVEDRMWGPVVAYIVVITVMVAAASSLWGTSRGAVALAGAFLFYVSDLTVARDTFVVRAFRNRMVGLPLYHAGQWLLAWSVAF